MTERAEGKGAVVPDEVLQLLEERRKVQIWMEKLLELRAGTTPTVYEKVRTDYEERLEDVSARLAEHRSDLEGSVARHRSRVEELQAERDAEAATLEEAELRFRVGEYGDEEWERRRAKGEAAIAELDEGLGEESEALSTLERVLGDLVSGGGAGPAAGETTAGTAPGLAPSGPGRPAAEAGEPRAERASEAPRDAAGDGPGPMAAPEPPAAPSAPPPEGGPSAEGARNGSGSTDVEEAVDEESAEYRDELEFLESLSLDDSERFDAVSLMLDELEEEGDAKGKGGEEERSR